MEDSEEILLKIRIGFLSKINRVISSCKNFLTNNNNKRLILYAVGGSIKKLIVVVEHLKMIIPGLYQINRLCTVLYKSVDEKDPKNQKLYPKMEVTLTFNKPIIITEGFQDNIPEEERKKLLDIFLKKKEERKERKHLRGSIALRGRRRKIRGKIRLKPMREKKIEGENMDNKELSEEERLQKERKEKEIIEKLEKLKKERERQRIENERKEKERKEKERKENERKEKERLEKEERERRILHEEINKKYNIIKNELPNLFQLDTTKLEKLQKSNNNKCLICFEIFCKGNQLLYLPCLHLFHSSCIMRWLLEKNTCPICIKDYRGIEEEDQKEEDQIEDTLENFFGNNMYMDNRYLDDISSISSEDNSFNYFNWRRGRGRGRGNWNNRGHWRGGRTNWRGRRGNWRGRRTFRGQRGRGGPYYNGYHSWRGRGRGSGRGS